MKICTNCNEHKLINEFRKCGIHKNGTQKYRGKCKLCEKTILQDLIKNKLGSECTSCGYNRNFSSLDLHHLDTKSKDMEVSSMKGYSVSKIEKEISKCILLCANCHRELHS